MQLLRLVSIVLIGLTFAGSVQAAPSFRQEAGLVPITDSVFYLGTTTPSLKAWLRVVADSFYDTDASDGCATWSSNVLTSTGSACGGVGGGISWPFTKQADNSQGTTTIMSFLGGFYSSASSTLTTFNFGTATGTSATTTGFAISGLSSELLKVNSLGSIIEAISGTDYEVPVTAGDGLTRTVNDFDCDTASGTVFGCLSSANWTTFNDKLGAMTFAFPWTKQTGNEQATTTVMEFVGGFLSNASSTVTDILATGHATSSGNVVALGNLRFDGEILPDGLTCSNGQILKKTGANDWDCATDDTGAGGGIAWPFTKLETNEQATSTIMAFLGGFLSTGSTTINTLLSDRATTTNATSTTYHISSGLSVLPLTSALLQTNTVGTFAEYAGTSCTNQFVRTLSALGIATCATVGSADVDLADLTAGDGLTSTGIYDGQTARTFSVTWKWPFLKLSTNEQATSTTMAFLNGFISTASSTATSLVATSTNLNVSANHISFGSNYVSATTSPFLRVASTTAGVEGTGFNVGTTTIHIGNWPETRIMRNVRCTATTTGGVIYRFRSGDTFSSTFFCDVLQKQTAPAFTFTKFTDAYIVVSKASTTPNLAGFTFDINKLSD